MKVEFTTRVGKFDVAVPHAAQPCLVAFKGSTAGKDGIYAFWTAVFKKAVNGKRKVIARARVGLPAGERFERMRIQSKGPGAKGISKEDRAIYARFYAAIGAGANLKCIRPSTGRELAKWLKGHREPEFGRGRKL